MEQFRFPLQKLLDLKIDKEEESKRKFIESQREKDKAEQRLDSMKQNYSRYNVIDKQDTLLEQRIRKNYLNALDTSIQQADVELKEKMSIVEDRRKDLKQKQIERKTVEVLKEKKLKAFVNEQNRIEQLQNDEFALYAFMRKLERR